ncbi:uncharacterized protein LOC123270446 isoform X2 [Cotesia glomerata]|uniref:uncharacterized protein LOC123270446 isoform X2 n=1 Tax=Cotesia glomerata TaxID=32391 RepID=UPI001D025CA1|nr:uncharacterized protein LOC123270446 isoform X2 [Cotesia glomerata]
MKILPRFLFILIIIIPLTKAKALLGIHCKQNGDCTPQNSYCNETSNRCRCTDGYYPANDKTTCVQYAKKVDEACERDVGCKFVEHSWCDNLFCKCRSEEFQAINNECKPQSRGACNADGTCINVVISGVCNNGQCTCTENVNYFGAMESYCALYTAHLYKFTSLEEGCKNIPNSYKMIVHGEKQCVCKYGYTYDKKNDMCLADIDKNCPDDSYCKVEYSFCNDWQKCECDYTYYPSTNKTSCIKYEIGKPCDQNKNCGPLQNSKCESNNCVCIDGATKGTDASSSCSCKKYFVQHNEFCYAVPGTVCSLTSKCLSSSYANLGTSCSLIKEHKEKYSSCSSKNGLTTCWMEDSNGQLTDFRVSIGVSREWICLVEHQDGTSVLGTVSAYESKCNVQWSTAKQSYESYKLLVDTRNLEWNKNYTLDSAVLGGTEGTNLFLICRTEVKIGTYVLGRLEPPNYKRCHIIQNRDHFQSKFQVLTVKGAPCSSENFTFIGGICKCSTGFYSYFRNCYKIPSRPNVPVDSFKECRYLKNTVYSGGKCVCKIGYYLDDNHCSKIPTGLEVPCDQCPTDSSCFENLCHCNPGFLKMNRTCYGFSGSECSKESKCASKSHLCQSGICKEVEGRKEDDKFCVGSMCWMPYDSKNNTELGVVGGTDDTGEQYVCRSIHGSVAIPGELRAHRWIRCLIAVGTKSISSGKFDMLVKNENLTWTKSFQLEQAVPGGTTEDNKPYLICRLEHDGMLYIGKLEPPYNLCSTGGKTVLISSDFEVLVDSTVPGTCVPECSAVDSVCSDGVCQCKPGFFKHNGTCYGLPQVDCSKSSKCISTAYSCESNKCLKIVEELFEGAQCVNSSKILVCWKLYNGKNTDLVTTHVDGDAKENVCRVKYENLFLPGRQPEGFEQCLVLLDDNVEAFDKFDVLSPKDDLGWAKSYSLDKAIPAGDFEEKPLLFCRTEVDGSAIIGTLVPPLYDLCYITYGWKMAVNDHFEVLVQKKSYWVIS